MEKGNLLFVPVKSLANEIKLIEVYEYIDDYDEKNYRVLSYQNGHIMVIKKENCFEKETDAIKAYLNWLAAAFNQLKAQWFVEEPKEVK